MALVCHRTSGRGVWDVSRSGAISINVHFTVALQWCFLGIFGSGGIVD